MIGNVLDRKQAFLDFKHVNFFYPATWIFPEGLVHDFGQKCESYLFLFLCVRNKLRIHV